MGLKDLEGKRTGRPPGSRLHRVSHNPGKTVTRLLVVMLHSRDVKELVIPEKKGH
jgi:hypothetical protein